MDDSATPLDDTLSRWLLECDAAEAAGRDLPALPASCTGVDASFGVEQLSRCFRLLGMAGKEERNTQEDGPSAPHELGRFEIHRRLGQGGHGLVFLAYDRKFGQRVALKLPRPEFVLSVDLMKRFYREAMLAGSLDHPNLVPILDAGQIGGICFVVSVYVPGPSLATWLAVRKQPVTPPAAARLVATLAEAVHHAHSRYVLHRDLKPGNVILQLPCDPGAPPRFTDEELTAAMPCIADFGLARLWDTSNHPGAGLTDVGASVGTPEYMAPEQARGDLATPATDVHALGILLYELLVGRPPYRGTTREAILEQVRRADPPWPQALRRDVPHHLQWICLRCLRKEPGRRYASAAALAEDLHRFLAGKPVRARPISVRERIWKALRGQPVVSMLLGAWLTTLLVLSVVAVDSHWRHERHQTELQNAADLTRRIAREAVQNPRQPSGTQPGAGPRVAISPGGKLVAMAQEGGQLWVWEPSSPSSRRLLQPQGPPIRSLVFSPDNRLLAASSTDPALQVWDLSTDKPRSLPLDSPSEVTALTFSLDGQTLTASNGKGVVQVWNAPFAP